jgi:hypothetical protein
MASTEICDEPWEEETGASEPRSSWINRRAAVVPMLLINVEWESHVEAELQDFGMQLHITDNFTLVNQ